MPSSKKLIGGNLFRAVKTWSGFALAQNDFFGIECNH